MRNIQKIITTTPAVEGAGVRLKRGFSYVDASLFDPFLLFDDFSNDDASAYKAGFPMHPHRGIETVTYLRKGEVRHKDSLGNEGSIGTGEVQWMTAGSGILHEEMPVIREGGIQGFQLWVNIPQEHKMMSPRYQDVKADEVNVFHEDGVTVRVIAGMYKEAQGPVQDLMVAPTYFDVTLGAYTSCTFPTRRDDTYFVYVYEGRLAFRGDRTESWIGVGEIGLLTHDTHITCHGGKDGVSFLLIGGTPLHEPVVGYGPIVMNTKEEIQTALLDLQNGTFIRTL